MKINNREFSGCSNANKVENLIVTHGKEPTILYNFGVQVKDFYVPKNNCRSVIGAGDVFLAGLVSNFLETKSLHDSIDFAVKAASRSVEKEGTCIVNRSEV